MRRWKPEDSIDLYNVEGWGGKYFGVNAGGRVFVKPREDGSEIDLIEVLEELSLKDVSTPALLRFPDILADRIRTISECFVKASEEYGFRGECYNIYPIKVNQVSAVVEEIMKHGAKFNIGLEAGSKPELHAVLAASENSDALIVCNGYKDEDFLELALLAQKMGKKIYLVVEKLNELRMIIDLAAKLKVSPNIGIRIKLSASGSGKWEDSGGDRSKFGLNSGELLEAVEILRESDLLYCLKLIHFHLGSQITNIRKIKNGLRECSQFYVRLVELGCGIEYVDIGGGLGVDYDGSRASSQSSVNYTLQEYANDAVAMIADACDKNDIKHPNVVTESGRALSAHHSVLVFDVLETASLPEYDEEAEVPEDSHGLIKELREIYDTISPSRMLEFWHDAQLIREEALDLFNLGLFDLKSRAEVEKLFWSIARELYFFAQKVKHPPEELRGLSNIIADKYFCNFSLFQSLPDSWAIDQIFPILPLDRLDEKPTRLATLQDITCDSDGKIDNFVGGARGFDNVLPVHKLKKGEPYYIGIFLVGAYQEILGDLHNLFGDANAVHISVTGDGYEIIKVIDGETVAEVLGYVDYDSKQLVRAMEKWVSSSVKAGKISSKEGKEFLATYRSGLYGYTYLDR